MQKILKKWPQSHRLVFLSVLILFWFSGAVFSYRHGNQAYFHTDETGEQLTIFAAKHFAEHGFLKNYLLPTYPPFGRDPEGHRRVEPFVYTHYLAGQDIVLGLVVKVFGEKSIWAGRLIPHTLTCIAVGWLAIEFYFFTSSSLMACLLLGFLMLPRALTAWSTCLYGHSYTMLFFIGMVAALLHAVRHKWLEKNLFFVGFTSGLLILFFDADWVALNFFAAMAFSLFLGFSNQSSKKLLIGVVAGTAAALGYQIFIGALYHGSLVKEITDVLQWTLWRAGNLHPDDGIHVSDLKLHRMFHLFNHQVYGGVGWTAINMIAISIGFVLMSSASKLWSTVQRNRYLLAILFSFLSSYVWTLIMRQHAFVHMRFIHRHAIVLYVMMVFIVLKFANDLIRSRVK